LDAADLLDELRATAEARERERNITFGERRRRSPKQTQAPKE
jgi:hypothetical protein